MTDKKQYGLNPEDIERIKGIEVIKDKNLPITVWDKEKQRWIATHLWEDDDKVYVSEELFLKLLEEEWDND